MEFRSLRLFNYLFRKSFRVPVYRNISNAAVQEESSSELLKNFNADIKAGGVVPVFKRALLFPSRVALQDEIGTYTYARLYQAATALSKDIAAQLLGDTERTISYMCTNSASHVVVQWAIWMTGNIAVPLTPLHPAEMLKYFITDSGSSLVICSEDFQKILTPVAKELSKPLLVVTAVQDQGNDVQDKTDSLSEVGHSNKWYGGTEAMLIYTSGTTSKPKGVVWTHSMLTTQIAALHTAWQYSAHDVVLHTLPLHHIHGQLNSLNASLAAGARIRMLPSFVSHNVWARLLGTGEEEDAKVSVFHGVPAMYAKLVADYEKMFTDTKTTDYVRSTLSSKMRLMCAGSAPLPETLFKKWEEISGIRLLERYGMSEVGMALSNPYRPVEDRTVACVGLPLPSTAARVASASDLKALVTVEADAANVEISLEKLGLTPIKTLEHEKQWTTKVTKHEISEDGSYQGELLLKGPAIFTRYWNRAPNPDSPDFTSDGWFRTGDTAAFTDGKFKILGRTSVDIIKTGGYKVSALQVESALLEHSSIQDAAVLGIEDDSYGEIVATVVVLKKDAKLTLKELKDEAGKKLAPYQLPKTMLIVDEMPRNAMGKLDKKVIRQKFGDQLVFKKN
ncbi:malonate--CoA ligase ACSF3, mitochondrial [Melitaea cinxia]|uniref:malonate--CoA ligase ACSF3, mitochondrial n=1 Tax=Melitaea cinxia TaxID=113334 RepID=UPI001E26F816|nr:malonate--CoA ligase ACSF3, mitochondrial [Melitaea cinxia]